MSSRMEQPSNAFLAPLSDLLSDHLKEIMRRAQITQRAPTLTVMYSGGVDSHLLLYTAACLNRLGALPFSLRALHINHQLSPNAHLWAAHCEQVAQLLDVALDVVTVKVDADQGLGLEAAARQARLDLLQARCSENDLVLLGHHEDDQVETILYRLFRGTGPAGAAGMSTYREYDGLHFFRPWLMLSRREIEEEAVRLGLQWIEDESNRSDRFDRNYLRHTVLPLLHQRWPQLNRSIAQFGRHCQASAEINEARAQEDLIYLLSRDGVVPVPASQAHAPHTHTLQKSPPEIEETLSCEKLLQLSPARRSNVIRYWLQRRTGQLVGLWVINAIVDQVLTAKADRNPVITWEKFLIKRYNHRLHIFEDGFDRVCMQSPADLSELSNRPVYWDPRVESSIEWMGQTLCAEHLPVFKYSTRVCEADAVVLAMDRLSFPLKVVVRQGGERIKPAGDRYTRKVKKLLQAGEIPPWERARIPMIYSGGGGPLVAVGRYWVSDGYQVKEGGEGLSLSMTLSQNSASK